MRLATSMRATVRGRVLLTCAEDAGLKFLDDAPPPGFRPAAISYFTVLKLC